MSGGADSPDSAWSTLNRRGIAATSATVAFRNEYRVHASGVMAKEAFLVEMFPCRRSPRLLRKFQEDAPDLAAEAKGGRIVRDGGAEVLSDLHAFLRRRAQRPLDLSFRDLFVFPKDNDTSVLRKGCNDRAGAGAHRRGRLHHR